MKLVSIPAPMKATAQMMACNYTCLALRPPCLTSCCPMPVLLRGSAGFQHCVGFWHSGKE